MTLQALCDLFPLSAPALALSLLPSLPITLQVPGSRSYSRLPEPPSCHSSLAFSTCNCVFQKWHSLPHPFSSFKTQPKYHLFLEVFLDHILILHYFQSTCTQVCVFGFMFPSVNLNFSFLSLQHLAQWLGCSILLENFLCHLFYLFCKSGHLKELMKKTCL